MAARKGRSSSKADALVRRAYRVTNEQDKKIKKLADASKGQLSDNDIVRMALHHGLHHVETHVLPAFLSPTEPTNE